MQIFGVNITDIAAAIGVAKSGVDTLKSSGDLIQTIRKALPDTSGNVPQPLSSFEVLRLASELADHLFNARLANLEILNLLQDLEHKVQTAQRLQDELGRYQLVTTAAGSTVLALKEGDPSGEPPHFCCPDCFENGQKRILQPDPSYGRSKLCGGCKSSFQFTARESSGLSIPDRSGDWGR